MTPSNQKTKNIRFFTLIILGALSPLILSFIYLRIYQSNPDLSLRNNGILFSQTITIDDLKLTQLKPFLAQDKWIFFQVLNDNCHEKCTKRASLISNMIVSLGKKAKRVQPVIFYSEKRQSEVIELLKPFPYHKNELMVADESFLNSIINELNQIISTGGAQDKVTLFIIDPLGRFVIAFDDEFDYKQIIADWTVLLKSSLIG